MGFSTVYRVLQEIFPQVDSRMLRAVAIEHSKDADAAVEVILVEVIPHLSNVTAAPCSSSEVAVEDAYQPVNDGETLQTDSTCLNETDGTPSDSPCCDANGSGGEVYNGDDGLISIEKHASGVTVGVIVEPDVSSHVSSSTMVPESSANDYCNQVWVNADYEEIVSLDESSSVEVSFKQGSHVLSNHRDNDNCSMTKGNQLADWEDCDGPAGCDCDVIIPGESCQERLSLDGNKWDSEDSAVQLVPLSAKDCTISAPVGSHQLEDQMLNSDYEKAEPSCIPNDAPNKDISITETIDFNDESTLNNVVTRSGQICRIDLLEDIIEDARNNKKTLFSVMESVLTLMREVELQEKAAEEAKEEAVMGGLDILSEAENLKQMLQHAREANEMQAGSVYGEKAILATEARGLQSRLLSLSDERDKSLAILDQMRGTLEERLVAAEKEMKEAEQEKMARLESARNALADQKLIMEKVVEESKILEQLKEENSKLDEFLKDRGHVVDTLQGEISVICLDVKLLKEKFDERVPLSKSLSSSQTSCILASSSSSLRSLSPDLVPEQAESSETPKNTTLRASDADQLSSGEEGADRKALVEDGWEFFDQE